MKKLLVTVISVILAISMLCLTACGSVFDGNYQEMSSEEVTALRSELSTTDVEFDPTAVSASNGYKISVDLDMKISMGTGFSMNTTANGTVKLVNQDDKVMLESKEKVSASVSMASETYSMSADLNADETVYYDGTTLYGKLLGDSTSTVLGTTTSTTIDTKGKQDIDLNSVLSNLSLDYLTTSLSEGLEICKEATGVKVSADKSGENYKIKIELDKEAMAKEFSNILDTKTLENITIGDCYIIFVYNNTTKAVVGIKQAMNISISTGYYVKMTYALEQCSDKITVPAEYKEFATVDNVFEALTSLFD